MQPEEITFGQLLNTRYPLVIPKYQRAYAWEKEQVEDFINDIRTVYSFNLANTINPKKHFFGGIVSIHVDEPGTQTGRRYDIVDGQQRLATFILALCNILKGLEVISIETTSRKERKEINAHINLIRDNFLKYFEIENGVRVTKNRLTMSQVDKQYFQDLINGHFAFPLRASHKRLLKAYEMLNQILVEPIVKNSSLTIRQKLQSLLDFKNCLNEHSYFIHIYSRDKVEAYKLFSVLNDRGMSLSDGDLLRSKTLEILEGYTNQQDRVVSYWDKLLAGDITHIDKYLKCYYTSIRGERAPQRDLFDKFTEHFFNYPLPIKQTQADELANKVNNLSIELEGYNSILEGDWPYTNSTSTSQVVAWDRSRLQILALLFKHSLCFPLLESSWKCLPENTFSEIVQILEKFAFRYIIVSGVHPGTAEGIYFSYARSIRENPQSFNIQSLKADLQNLIFSNAPDNLFEQQLLLLLDYSQSPKRKLIRYFLTVIESYWFSQHNPLRRVTQPIEADKMITFNFDQTTIEHVYPQTPRQGKIDNFLEPEKHLIGNLSIWAPGENNRAGNLPFNQKIGMYQGSSLLINRQLGTLTSWNITELNNRKHVLLDMAKKIFSL